MTAAEEWTAIAEACEKATGPDRELDARISVGARLKTDTPKLTASLDAITAMIQGNQMTESTVHSYCGGRHSYRALVFSQMALSNGVLESMIETSAPTPALALCAAFARAMAEREGMKEAANG